MRKAPHTLKTTGREGNAAIRRTSDKKKKKKSSLQHPNREQHQHIARAVERKTNTPSQQDQTPAAPSRPRSLSLTSMRHVALKLTSCVLATSSPCTASATSAFPALRRRVCSSSWQRENAPARYPERPTEPPTHASTTTKHAQMHSTQGKAEQNKRWLNIGGTLRWARSWWVTTLLSVPRQLHNKNHHRYTGRTATAEKKKTVNPSQSVVYTGGTTTAEKKKTCQSKPIRGS